MRRIEVDEDGRLHLHRGKEKPLIDLPWELRAVVVWLMRAMLIVAAAYQLHSALPGP